MMDKISKYYEEKLSALGYKGMLAWAMDEVEGFVSQLQDRSASCDLIESTKAEIETLLNSDAAEQDIVTGIRKKLTAIRAYVRLCGSL